MICTTRPITSMRQALDLLTKRFGDGTLRYVRTVSRGRRVKVIAVEVYAGSRDELSHVNEYVLDEELFVRIQVERLIIGSPYWGGRSTTEFEPTEALAILFWKHEIPHEPGEEELPDVHERAR